jgi:hypothetical protein
MPVAPALSRPVLVIALVALVACARGPAELGMSDSTYVQVLAELRQVGDQAGVAPALRATRRDAVFRKHKVSPQAIEAASAALAAEPQRAAELWRKVDEKAAALPPLR